MTTRWDDIKAGLTDPIPNLLDKHGGPRSLTPIVTDFCTRLLAMPSTRRCYGDTPVAQVISHSLALFALVLGEPIEDYDFTTMRNVFRQNHITQHTYEQIALAMRHVLLSGGYLSREASISVNVMDIYCEAVFGIAPLRTVNSPFTGVDRRSRARGPNKHSIT